MTLRTPTTEASYLLEEKGSRFIAALIPITEESAVRNYQQALKQQHPKASHVCYGWRVMGSEKRPLEGFSDDGEPSGTAGMPILRQLQHAGAINTVILITRYFGGTKLGTGGLQRAYGQAAGQALQAINETNWEIWLPQQALILTAPFQREADVRRLISQAGGHITGVDYTLSGLALGCQLAEADVPALAASLPFDVTMKEASL
ncbi:IMPACT family protein [Thalassolituus sp. LLYu03]|uniref:IMPACT family protein n=1 Tax=Thalassolituus sp. LLYu03 TaxID=3421656 RepID=UPI003D284E51